MDKTAHSRLTGCPDNGHPDPPASAIPINNEQHSIFTRSAAHPANPKHFQRLRLDIPAQSVPPKVIASKCNLSTYVAERSESSYAEVCADRRVVAGVWRRRRRRRRRRREVRKPRINYISIVYWNAYAWFIGSINTMTPRINKIQPPHT